MQIVSDQDGSHYFAFQLYDSRGSLVAQSDGLQQYPNGLTVRCRNGELLLSVPRNPRQDIRYRLYNSYGNLLTCSDGARTLIYPMLRMGGERRR